MNLVHHPWNLVFLAGFVVYFGIRHRFIQQTKGEKKAVSRKDGLEHALLTGMFVTVMVLPMVYLFTPLLGFADYRLPALLPWIGATAMIASLWLFWRSHVDLGQNWSVSLELREQHELVTQGIYRRIRHPMYASIWLWALAQGLMLPNWLAGWGAVPAFLAMYVSRLPREEGMMEEKFGEAYREYAKRTGRVLPKMKRK